MNIAKIIADKKFAKVKITMLITFFFNLWFNAKCNTSSEIYFFSQFFTVNVITETR